MAMPDTTAIERELDRIRSLGVAELRMEWRRLNRGAPPKLSRDLLALALGYQLQEREHGGLSKSTRRKLQTMAKGLQATGRVGPSPSLSLKPGARLVREWHGRTHTVTVTEDGFEHEGTSYRVPDQHRQEDHRSPLVRAPVLRAAGDERLGSQRRGRPRWLNRTRGRVARSAQAPLCHLHTEVHRRGTGSGLQLARCPA